MAQANAAASRKNGRKPFAATAYRGRDAGSGISPCMSRDCCIDEMGTQANLAPSVNGRGKCGGGRRARARDASSAQFLRRIPGEEAGEEPIVL